MRLAGAAALWLLALGVASANAQSISFSNPDSSRWIASPDGSVMTCKSCASAEAMSWVYFDGAMKDKANGRVKQYPAIFKRKQENGVFHRSVTIMLPSRTVLLVSSAGSDARAQRNLSALVATAR